jgi:ribosomal protein S18 acetylase RimI-like enzyme
MNRTAAVSLRPAAPADEPFVRELIFDVLAEELMASLWPEAIRGPLLEMQYTARRQAWLSRFPEASYSIITADGAPVGRLVVAATPEEIRIVDIAVAAPHRGAGVGTAVLQEIFAESQRAGIPVRLSVSIMNRALRLYERLDFRRIGGDEVYHDMEHRPDAGRLK